MWDESMTIWPVISRELRVEAKQASTFWLRGISVFTTMLVCLYILDKYRGAQNAQGQVIFSSLNTIIFFTIWIVAPLLSADCISRERREGTLGLLFLTPLNPKGIAIGKSFTYGLKGLSLLVAAIPVITIAFIMGGVSSVEVLTAIVINLIALAVALSAGLLASACSKEWIRTMILAEVFALVFFIAFRMGLSISFEWYRDTFSIKAMPTVQRSYYTYAIYSSLEALRFLQSMAGLDMLRSYNLVSRGYLHWLSFLALLTLGGWLWLSVVICVAALRIAKSWKEEPPSKRQLWLTQAFCVPRFWRRFFRRSMKKKLEHNPIIWLHNYAWSARLSKWGWLLVVIIVDLVLVIADLYDYIVYHSLILFLLVFAMSISIAGSFKQERSNGALELILVTSISERQLIWGRMLGFWRQFLPVGILFIWFWYSAIHTGPRNYRLVFWQNPFLPFQLLQSPFVFVSTFLCLPAIGLYFSFRANHFSKALFGTIAMGIVIPLVCSVFMSGFMLRLGIHRFFESAKMIPLCSLWICQVSVAIGAYTLLLLNLRNRKFVMA
jgi:ABC-type transport system involved in multi-copper enzyme maturation permease subunit